jgi:hypothetical protein
MLVLELARSDYIERRVNIIALGDSGTGKSHIALGLGLAACQKGLSVGFITASALVHELLEARDEKRLLRLQRQLAAYKLLIIDELGYVPLSPAGAELLFEVFSQRYGRGSTLVTTSDIGVRFRAASRSADASRPYTGDEWRQLQACPFKAPLSPLQGRAAIGRPRSGVRPEKQEGPRYRGPSCLPRCCPGSGRARALAAGGRCHLRSIFPWVMEW